MNLHQNHFEIFGFPRGFDVDLVQLSSRYRDLQKSVHPDRFATAPEQQRRLALQKAAQINEGFEILKDPLRRGRYLLELGGLMVDDELDTKMDPAFLIEQMELRETLAEIDQANDPLAAVEALLVVIRQRIRDLVDELARLFLDEREEAMGQARDVVRKMQFLYRLREEASSKAGELEDKLL